MAVGGLRGQGLSSHKGGSPIIRQLRNFGWPQKVLHPAGGVVRRQVDHTSGILMIVFTFGVLCRTGSCEVCE